jgi:hypothetical protein
MIRRINNTIVQWTTLSPAGVMGSAAGNVKGAAQLQPRGVKQMIPIRIRSLWARTLHLFEHALAVTLALALVIVGLALTFSIVFVVPGVIVLSLGVATVVRGIFAHAFARRTGP